MNTHFLILLFTIFSLQFLHGDARRTSTSSTTDDDDDDDAYVTLVKSYIDDGTCTETSKTTICGDDASSYYNEFTYNGNRVVIVNGIPDHPAENDALDAPILLLKSWYLPPTQTLLSGPRCRSITSPVPASSVPIVQLPSTLGRSGEWNQAGRNYPTLLKLPRTARNLHLPEPELDMRVHRVGLLDIRVQIFCTVVRFIYQ